MDWMIGVIISALIIIGFCLVPIWAEIQKVKEDIETAQDGLSFVISRNIEIRKDGGKLKRRVQELEQEVELIKDYLKVRKVAHVGYTKLVKTVKDSNNDFYEQS